jgi:uncharacterized membrane protein YciS (DUF1049 family)
LIVLRRILFIALLIVLVTFAAVISYTNPEPITVDIGVMRLEGVSLALVLAVTFALGWLFGMSAAGFGALKNLLHRRRLNKDLKVARSRIREIDSLPLKDAD